MEPSLMRLHLLCILIFAMSCQSSENSPSGSAVGTRFRPPELRPASDRHVWKTTGCRVVVVTTAGCGISRALIQGWSEDLHPLVDSVRSSVGLSWIFFGSRDELPELLSNAGENVPPIYLARGGAREMERWLHLAGSPHTLVITPMDTVRAVISGNQLPTLTDLVTACDGPSD